MGEQRRSSTEADRVAEVRAWAASRIATCREQERKFAEAWTEAMRVKHQHGPPQALVEAWTERRALEGVLRILEETDG